MHPLIIGRNNIAGFHIQIGLTGKRRTAGGISAKRPLKRPKSFAERHLLIVIKRLTGNDQYGIGVQDLADFIKNGIFKRQAEIDPGHLSTKNRC